MIRQGGMSGFTFFKEMYEKRQIEKVLAEQGGNGNGNGGNDGYGGDIRAYLKDKGIQIPAMPGH